MHRKTNTVHWVSSSNYFWCSSYMFRHLRAILRERFCPCEYVKTRQLHTHKDKNAPWGWHVGADTCRSCNKNKYLTKPSAQCWFFYAQPSNARYKHQKKMYYLLVSIRYSRIKKHPSWGNFFRTYPDRYWGPNYVPCYNGYGAYLPGSKRPGHGIDHTSILSFSPA
jgi:hypothetical protein